MSYDETTSLSKYIEDATTEIQAILGKLYVTQGDKRNDHNILVERKFQKH